ncbi:glucosyl transferase [Waterburya agarophytonicola K14]|uniref:Glucosyl transferase n=1 Tax=Waterburya agarophytonicola KI4 TaxID=2874699 RepID=A0A964BXV4_9CYAN|nr:glycosyltransferase [Waterburya agarophytonicola]MCC0179225.1 glucosyl transferase [Waterburya agarophytonicola KI4]
MILVTVGTERFPFNRLMGWIDNLIEQNFLDPEQEEIVIQYGSSNVLPKQGRKYDLLPQDDFHKLMSKARLIIAHCGEGTIDLLAEYSKPFILVPRSKQFEEHVDNHQLELAEKLAEIGIPIAKSPGSLAYFLANPIAVEINNYPSKYYAKASVILENQFDTDKVLEDLTEDFIGDLIPSFS